MRVNYFLNKLNECSIESFNINDREHFIPENKLESYDVSVIIPVLNRDNIIGKTLRTLQKAISDSDYVINLIVVEYSEKSKHKNLCVNSNIEYFYLKSICDSSFNKSLTMNIGSFIANNSKYFLFHDVDCLVPNNFFELLFKNVNNVNANIIQTFGGGRLSYCSERLTKNILTKDLSIDSFIQFKSDITIPESTILGIKAPGGSILINKDLFIKVGGFDYELFSGYSPEDAFFKNKCETLGETLFGSDNPFIEQYHLYHEASRIPEIEMLNYVNIFNSLSKIEKLEYLKVKNLKMISDLNKFLG